MTPAQTLDMPPGPAPSPADPALAPDADTVTTRGPVLTRRRLQAIGGLVVAVAFAASEETRVLVLLIGFAAVVAALAGPWGFAFWRLAQPSLFVEAGETVEDRTPASVPTAARRPIPRLGLPDESMAA